MPEGYSLEWLWGKQHFSEEQKTSEQQKKPKQTRNRPRVRFSFPKECNSSFVNDADDIGIFSVDIFANLGVDVNTDGPAPLAKSTCLMS